MNLGSFILFRLFSKHVTTFLIFSLLCVIANSAAKFAGLIFTNNEYVLVLAAYVLAVVTDVAIYTFNKNKELSQ